MQQQSTADRNDIMLLDERRQPFDFRGFLPDPI